MAKYRDGPGHRALQRFFTSELKRFSSALRWALLILLVSPSFIAEPAAEAAGASLRGGPRSMARQTRAAGQHDYTFLLNADQVHSFVRRGYLVAVPGGRDYELSGVSFPFARPEVKLFIERLSRQYRQACGEKLVVTSLTRPRSHQPANASRRSVHQAGMALDIRRSWNRRCRSWLERVLLDLEREEVLDGNYERRPPHYHVAVFPRPYADYVARLSGGASESASSPNASSYRVRRGDTLWNIAQRHDTSVEELRIENGLRSNRIQPGQLLRVPPAR